MLTAKCPQCGSDRIIPDVRINDQAGHYVVLGVSVYEHPDALLFRGTHSRTLRSQVCGECGYVASFVDNPQELYEIYLAARQEKGPE